MAEAVTNFNGEYEINLLEGTYSIVTTDQRFIVPEGTTLVVGDDADQDTYDFTLAPRPIEVSGIVWYDIDSLMLNRDKFFGRKFRTHYSQRF